MKPTSHAERVVSAANEPALEYLRTLAGERFWGSVEIKFENGTPVYLRRTEGIRLDGPSKESRLQRESEST